MEFQLILSVVSAFLIIGGAEMKPKASQIIFEDQGAIRFGSSESKAETETSQKSTGDGHQSSTADASGETVQHGLGGNKQVAISKATAQADQNQGQGKGGSQRSNVSAISTINQTQLNVNGTLVNIGTNHTGIVNVNVLGKDGAVLSGQLINNKPVANRTVESSNCKYYCKRHGVLYCCDDGSNPKTNGNPTVHGGYCPAARLVCVQHGLFIECAHDGQCAESDRCCLDACANRHICKQAVDQPPTTH